MALVPYRHRGGLTTGSEHPLELFRREMDNLFNRWMAPFGQDFGPEHFWDFDVQEKDQEILVRAEMPGFEEKDLNVELNGDVLTIKAERQEEHDGERSFRRFSRSVTLPAGVDAAKVQAAYRNGVLEMHIPRPEGANPKRITVRGQGATESESRQPETAQSQAGSAQGNGGAPAEGKKTEKARSRGGK